MNDQSSLATRRTLLERLKNWGDQESWQQFFDRYWGLIYGVARKTGLTDAEAQEAVQETVINVAKSIEKFHYDPARCSFKSWLLRSARWYIIRQFQKRHREAKQIQPRSAADTGTDLIERVPDPASLDLEAIWEDEWHRGLYDAAVEVVKGRVNPEQFQIFDLYVTEGCPAPEVARTLGVSIAKVYVTKHRIARMIAKEVRKLEEGKI